MYRRHAAVLLCASVLSCGGESGPNGVDIGTIVVTPTSVALAQQASLQLQVSVLDPDGALLTGIPVTFASASTAIVTVSNTGLVGSAGPAGTSTVMVSAGGESVEVPVTIAATGNTIRLLPSPAVVAQLQTLQLDAALLDLVGTPIAGTVFTYATSTAAIATVSQTGLVTSTGPAGQVSITATSGALSAQVQLAVTAVPTSIELGPPSITIAKATSLPLVALVRDAFGQPMTTTITFSASPASHLTVSQAGVLTASNLTGAGTVTATAGTLSASAPVTIVDIGSLGGTIASTSPAAGQPYAVLVAPGGLIYGSGIQGTLHIGTFGSTSIQSFQISPTMTVGLARSPVTGLIYVAGAGADALMEVHQTTGAVLRRWAAPEQMFDVAVSPDGQQIYVGGEGNKVHVISASTMAKVTDFPAAAAVVHLLAHPSLPLVYASGQDQAREINVQTGATRTFAVANGQAAALALTQDRLFVAGENTLLGVVTLATGTVTTTAIPNCAMYDVVASPDGKQLLVTCVANGSVKLLDAATLATITTINTTGVPRRAAISADGLTAAVANESGWYDHIR